LWNVPCKPLLFLFITFYSATKSVRTRATFSVIASTYSHLVSFNSDYLIKKTDIGHTFRVTFWNMLFGIQNRTQDTIFFLYSRWWEMKKNNVMKEKIKPKLRYVILNNKKRLFYYNIVFKFSLAHFRWCEYNRKSPRRDRIVRNKSLDTCFDFQK
jgi:hypothetical protein